MKKSFALLFASLMLIASARVFAQEKISEPFKYRGYSEKLYSDYAQKSTYVEMSDGVKLAVDIYLPRKGPKKSAFPVVVEYTPYSRAFINPGFAPLDGKKQKNMMGGRGAVVPMPFSFNMDFIEQGYALVIADIRGSGASFGSRFDMSPIIGSDGAELIEWIASQSWCDGNIGMKGASYMGISQLLTVAEKPEHLKAAFMMIYPFGYHDIYAGGIYNTGFMVSFSELLWTMNMNMNRSAGGFPVMPSAPVVDEDGDGLLLDEIPIDKDGDGTFLNDYNFPDDPNDPPQYEDGESREHLYYLATRDHLANPKINDWFKKSKFVDTSSDSLGLADKYGSFTGYDIGPASRMTDIMDSGIPMYHVAGWFDTFLRSNVIFYSSVKETNPSKLLVMPYYHLMTSPFLKYFGDKTRMDLGTEQLRFFDHYLKGIDNDIEKEDPINIYVMGEGLRSEKEWPLPEEKDTTFFFNPDGALTTDAGAPGTDKYTTDYSHHSAFGSNEGNRWKMYIIPSEVPDRAEQDKKCLTYTTAPLEEDLEVTGHPIVNFWVSSTADYGDFYVYLSSVDEEGKAILVTEQPHRAGFATLKDNDTMVRRGELGIEVLPELPWHGYEMADYTDAIFKDGNIVNMHFDLMPTSWVFKKGHRIRVSIATSDWPTFPLHEKLAPENDPAAEGVIVPEITIYRDEEHPSGIILPVIEK